MGLLKLQTLNHESNEVSLNICGQDRSRLILVFPTPTGYMLTSFSFSSWIGGVFLRFFSNVCLFVFFFFWEVSRGYDYWYYFIFPNSHEWLVISVDLSYFLPICHVHESHVTKLEPSTNPCTIWCIVAF